MEGGGLASRCLPSAPEPKPHTSGWRLGCLPSTRASPYDVPGPGQRTLRRARRTGCPSQQLWFQKSSWEPPRAPPKLGVPGDPASRRWDKKRSLQLGARRPAAAASGSAATHRNPPTSHPHCGRATQVRRLHPLFIREERGSRRSRLAPAPGHHGHCRKHGRGEPAGTPRSGSQIGGGLGDTGRRRRARVGEREAGRSGAQLAGEEAGTSDP